MARIRIEDVHADAPPLGFWELLALSIGNATSEKIASVQACYEQSDCGLAAALVDQDVAGVIGYRRRRRKLEIMHIAVRKDFRRQGAGRSLISAISQRHIGCELVAETDDDAVDFYRAIGFETEELPRPPGRTRRWRCRMAKMGQEF